MGGDPGCGGDRAEPLFRQISACPACRADATPLLCPVAAATSAILLDIMQPAVGLAIWVRTAEAAWQDEIQPYAAGLDAAHVACGAPDAIVGMLFRRFPRGIPGWLAEDVTALAGLLAALCRVSRVTARLSVAAAHDIPAANTIRLLCRYGGAALHWWDPDPAWPDRTSGIIDPFCVVLIKGAPHPAGRQRMIRLADKPPHVGAAGLTLVMEPAP